VKAPRLRVARAACTSWPRRECRVLVGIRVALAREVTVALSVASLAAGREYVPATVSNTKPI